MKLIVEYHSKGTPIYVLRLRVRRKAHVWFNLFKELCRYRSILLTIQYLVVLCICRYDLLTILTRVNQDVQELSHVDADLMRPVRQVPQPTHTLKKRILFQ